MKKQKLRRVIKAKPQIKTLKKNKIGQTIYYATFSWFGKSKSK
jgi:hypothetical protein